MDEVIGENRQGLGILGETSWGRHLGANIMEGASSRREASWSSIPEALVQHLGDIRVDVMATNDEEP